jgi:Protein of unknown function (DUF3237)
MANDRTVPLTRRMFAAAPALVPLAVAVNACSATPAASAPVFTVRLKTEPVADFQGRQGARQLLRIVGGEVTGPRLEGEVVGGDEWMQTDKSGAQEELSRYAIRAKDGAVIGVATAGLRAAAGDPSQAYYHVTPKFDVAPGPHQWLTESLFVAVFTGAGEDARWEFREA